MAENLECICSVEEMVRWMGHPPVRINFSSGYFHDFHELALELIRRGKAFVCHQSAARANSPMRGRPTEDYLREFRRMRKGSTRRVPRH